MTGLSLCMVVRDEQDRLPRCLASVAGLVDEIVVVDTGSTDATVDVARAHGAMVIAHDFTRVDFALARNRGLDAAHGRFALVLDADEVLHPGSAPLVRHLMATGGEVGWIVARRNIPDGCAEPAWVDHAVRLFPNHPRYRFRRRIHETVDDAILDAGGRLLRSSVVLDHHLTPAEDLRGKWRRYVDLMREDLADHPDDVDRLVFLMADYYKLGEYDLATATARRIAELCPDDADAQLDAALCTFAHAGDLTAARGYLAAAVAISPDDPRIRQLVEDLAEDLAPRAGVATRSGGGSGRSASTIGGAAARANGCPEGTAPAAAASARPADNPVGGIGSVDRPADRVIASRGPSTPSPPGR